MVPHIRRVWHSLTTSETVRALHVQPESGLDDAEAQQRLENFGPNEIVPVRRQTLAHTIAEAITEPMILLLLAVGVLYAFWGEVWETATVFAVIAVLVGVESFNEWRTELALAKLAEVSQPTALVRRHGQWREVALAAVVPGDIVLLLPGRRVPADVRLLENRALAIDESILTGESFPVEKDAEAILSEVVPLAERKNMAFAGTLVLQGRGLGVVVATGEETEWGRIVRQAGVVRSDKTPLQKAMQELARWAVVLALGSTALAAGLAYIRQQLSGQQAILSALALALFTIPEELPIIITMVLALGGWRLSRQKVLVRRLQAIETLGGVTVIASDKTGTITENRMAVERVEPSEQERRCLELAVLCSETLTANLANSSSDTPTRTWIGDPTEAALLERAYQLHIHPDSLPERWTLRREFGFDPIRKRMSTVWRIGDQFFIAVKGAAESILPLCHWELADQGPHSVSRGNSVAVAWPGSTSGDSHLVMVPLNDDRRQYWQQRIEALAQMGLRTLACACRWAPQEPRQLEQAEAELIFVGLVALADPPRPEVASALEECRQAGIRVLLITGDHPNTARYVAQAVGFSADTPLITGPELERLPDAAVQSQLRGALIVARATPTQKLRLVQLAKAAGDRVAVTGDGVNDAPALRAADVGIAMGQRGSDVAREAADLVLADDNFATLVHAIREGRLLFANLSKSVRYYLACKIALVVPCLVGVLAGVGIPFHPLQIILLELIVDLGASVALVSEPAEANLMQRKPRDPRQPFLHGRFLADLFGSALVLATTIVLVFLGLLWLPAATTAPHFDRETVMGGSFLAWLVGHAALAWGLRTDSARLSQQGWLSNRALLVWTLAIFGFLLWAWLPGTWSRFFLLQRLTGQQITAIAAGAVAIMMVWRWFRVRYVTGLNHEKMA